MASRAAAKSFFLSVIVICSPGRWTRNNFFFKGGLLNDQSLILSCELPSPWQHVTVVTMHNDTGTTHIYIVHAKHGL